MFQRSGGVLGNVRDVLIGEGAAEGAEVLGPPLPDLDPYGPLNVPKPVHVLELVPVIPQPGGAVDLNVLRFDYSVTFRILSRLTTLSAPVEFRVVESSVFGSTTRTVLSPSTKFPQGQYVQVTMNVPGSPLAAAPGVWTRAVAEVWILGQRVGAFTYTVN
jgi:hypothetical protein